MKKRAKGKTREQKVAEMVETVINLIETEGVNWSSGWRDVGISPRNIVTKHIYSGFNAIWLLINQAGYVSTFKGWQSLGFSCKGLKGIPIRVRKVHKVEENGEEVEKVWYTFDHVFRAEDVRNENGESWVAPAPAHVKDQTEVLADIEAYFSRIPNMRIVESETGGAFFDPTGDFIQIPTRNRYEGTATSTPTMVRYSTLAHEAIHWTGVKHRKNRPHDYSTREGRSREELCAEMGAQIFCIEHGIEPTVREDHAAYLGSWLKALKGKDGAKYLFSAAKEATEAVDYLNEKALIKKAA